MTMPLAFCCFLAVAVTQVGSSPPGVAGSSDASIAGRVDAYVSRGGPPKELGAIASAVLDALRNSRAIEKQIPACSFKSPGDAPCAELLPRIAGDDRVPMVSRLRAAAALLLRQEDDSKPALFDRLAKGAVELDLTAALDAIVQLPAEKAVPPLIRVLDRGEEPAKIMAARALGNFSTNESIAALQTTGGSAPAGSPLWFAVTGSRARLGDPDALVLIGATHAHMTAPDLVSAGEAFLAASDPRAEPILMLAARTATGPEQLRAAALVREKVPELFSRLMVEGLQSQDADARLEALRILARIQSPLLPAALRLLLDPDPRVSAAAARYSLESVALQP